ncbi:DUF1659 domain-containing protein [Serpentinicella sp. ANB-PHB4]|uniref:DUF1659 domain-containing protein n=1 Tax=Serpentinicella sp. ANB-PHB4 TaxID=3074076 RepID=UPI00285E13B3|nr:DUF1659 domain-containing protein [Serpentinicella sp. ANB-PHB4]MDR5659939.1 DUF1659 domain-containing protein [Serpentinicella sp. ANB-PHB4]
MATVINESTRLRIRVVDSVDENGNERYSSRTYNNVRPEATNEAILNTTQEMVALQEKPVNAIVKISEQELGA